MRDESCPLRERRGGCRRARDQGLLVEREQVLGAATALLEQTGEGSGGSLFILGEAGLGKTAVLERVRQLANAKLRIGVGQGDVMESSLPFGLLVEALAGIGGADALIEGVAAASAAEARAARFYATLRWLEGEAGTPLLLVLDDLHWADQDSLALLSFLCRRLRRLPVAVVGALRPWPSEARDVALALEHAGYAGTERLAPLSREATGVMLANRVGQPIPVETVGHLWERCGGNPLLLQQAAVALERGEDLPGGADGTAAPVAEHHLLLSRFAGLPAKGMRWAQAASVLGTRFPFELAGEVAGIGPEATTAVEAVWRAGLVRQGEHGVAEFVHPLFGQAVYDDMPPPTRTRLHRRAFELLAERGRDVEAAEHALQARPLGEPAAVSLLERVGRQALQTGAPATAARFLNGAVELAADRAEPGLFVALNEAWTASGRLAPAVGALERALSQPRLSERDRAETLRRYGRALWATGTAGRAASVFTEAVETALPAHPEIAAGALLDHAFLLSLTGGPVAALPLAEQARNLSRRLEEGTRRRVEAAWHLIALESGDATALDDAAAAARDILARDDPAALLGDLQGGQLGALNSYGVAATWTERLADADQIFALSLRELERAGAAGVMLFQACAYLLLLVRGGRLDEGLALAGRAATLIELVPALAPYPALAESWFLLQMGRRDDHERAWRRGMEAATAGGDWHAALWLRHIEGVRLLRDGRFREASDAYRAVEREARDGGVGEPCVVPWSRHGVTAHVAAGRPGDARRVVEWLDKAAERLPCRWPRAAAAAGRAALAEADGNAVAARAEHRMAIALIDGADLPLERVELILAYGDFLLRGGHLVDARGPLAEALAVAERFGAQDLARRAHDALRRAGGRRRRPAGEPHRLTPAEERVARLAAEGAGNREIAERLFLSEATVKTHLERTFAKLGLHSRRELIARWRTGEGSGDGRDDGA